MRAPQGLSLIYIEISIKNLRGSKKKKKEKKMANGWIQLPLKPRESYLLSPVIRKLRTQKWPVPLLLYPLLFSGIFSLSWLASGAWYDVIK